MWWIIGLTALVLVGLSAWYADDRRENLRSAVLDVVRNKPGCTGDEVAFLVEGAVNRRVPIAEAYGVLCELREYGLVVSEYQRLPDGFGEIKVKDGLPMVWRAVEGASV